MELHLKEITTILSSQNYLDYEKILDSMLDTVKNSGTITIHGMGATISTVDEVHSFNRRMMQVHGIYGLV